MLCLLPTDDQVDAVSTSSSVAILGQDQSRTSVSSEPMCSVCLETAAGEDLFTFKCCGHSLHILCAAMLRRADPDGRPPCPMCRTSWQPSMSAELNALERSWNVDLSSAPPRRRVKFNDVGNFTLGQFFPDPAPLERLPICCDDSGMYWYPSTREYSCITCGRNIELHHPCFEVSHEDIVRELQCMRDFICPQLHLRTLVVDMRGHTWQRFFIYSAPFMQSNLLPQPATDCNCPATDIAPFEAFARDDGLSSSIIDSAADIPANQPRRAARRRSRSRSPNILPATTPERIRFRNR